MKKILAKILIVVLFSGIVARKLPIRFDFLPEGKKYTARIYSDDEKSKTKTKVSIKEIEVSRETEIEADLVGSGGIAIWVKPSK
jgi:alpha-glucosidase